MKGKRSSPTNLLDPAASRPERQRGPRRLVATVDLGARLVLARVRQWSRPELSGGAYDPSLMTDVGDVLERAGRLLAEGNFVEEVNLLEDASLRFPTDPNVRLLLAHAFARLG